MTDRLVLGTVQLGMPYGIGNETGKPNFDHACRIVHGAFENGITRFDTAQAYGNSEEVLGRVFDKFKLAAKVKVYSKLHSALDLSNEDAVRTAVDGSLCRLKVDQLEGLLLHHEDSVRFWDKGLGDLLQELVRQGKVKSIGVSFYAPPKALAALDINGIDLIQVPANILDKRFEDAGVFKKSQERGKKVFVRSVFLQGLLLMPLDRVPVPMAYARPYLEQLEQMAFQMKVSRQELFLGYAEKRWPDSFVLFGAENEAQVTGNVRAFSSRKILKIDDNIFRNVPENIVNPMLWPKL
ncbi:MAG: aldo/keto reductase [Candidatus Omnitrophica bacterium]|nr:aldo/keto reductase [Candidatus Omnitrophota bacterium]